MKIFRKLLILVLCKWLRIHWITTHIEDYDDDGTPFLDRWCNLCFYWPGIDDSDDYDYFEVLK